MFKLFWNSRKQDDSDSDYDIEKEFNSGKDYDIESASYLKKDIKNTKQEFITSTNTNSHNQKLKNSNSSTNIDIVKSNDSTDFTDSTQSTDSTDVIEVKKRQISNESTENQFIRTLSSTGSLNNMQKLLNQNLLPTPLKIPSLSPVSTPISTPTSTPINKNILNEKTNHQSEQDFISHFEGGQKNKSDARTFFETQKIINDYESKMNMDMAITMDMNMRMDEDNFSNLNDTNDLNLTNEHQSNEPEHNEITDIKLYNRTMNKINKLKEQSSYTNYKNEKSNKHDDSEKEESDYESDLSDDEQSEDASQNDELDFEPDNFTHYVLKESIRSYNHNSFYCQFLWSGIEHLDHWELQRKLNKNHAKQILSQMKKDYNNNQKKFTFYDVIHLAIKPDGKYYVIDGQHRLVAYFNLYLKNVYPIQKVPAVIWTTKSDEEFLEIYERINKRVPFDVTPFNKKILDIIFQMDNTFNKVSNIWGKKRPKIDKNLFIEEMKTNDYVHKLDADTIVKKIIEINIKIRGLPRSKRTDSKVSSQVHTTAEEMDFYLGYDKSLKWIHEINDN